MSRDIKTVENELELTRGGLEALNDIFRNGMFLKLSAETRISHCEADIRILKEGLALKTELESLKPKPAE